jgi:hypothetical protein
VSLSLSTLLRLLTLLHFVLLPPPSLGFGSGTYGWMELRTQRASKGGQYRGSPSRRHLLFLAAGTEDGAPLASFPLILTTPFSTFHFQALPLLVGFSDQRRSGPPPPPPSSPLLPPSLEPLQGLQMNIQLCNCFFTSLICLAKLLSVLSIYVDFYGAPTSSQQSGWKGIPGAGGSRRSVISGTKGQGAHSF